MHLLLLGVHAVLAHLVQREQRAERPLRELLSSPVDALQVAESGAADKYPAVRALGSARAVGRFRWYFG